MPAGFLFSISSADKDNALAAIESTIVQGRYATLMGDKWSGATAATLGDFINMKPGDNVYLFAGRMVYGIGEIVSILDNGEAAYELYPNASTKSVNPPPEFTLQTKDGKTRCFRWAVNFRPSPYFFIDGIDMDDLLSSDPAAFRSLRSFWKRSFIQLDDRENSAFRSALIRRNERSLLWGDPGNFFESPTSSSIEANKSIARPIDIKKLVAESRNRRGELSSEMILEAAILSGIKRQEESAIDSFGEWDYLSHQVIASPFKPIDYMDRIDIFGYRWVPGYEGEIISKYMVAELKRGPISLSDSSGRDYNQLMKYVDWVCKEYAHGDYSMIEAFLVGSSCSFNNSKAMSEAITRPYVTGHQAQAHTWDNMNFIQYVTTETGDIAFNRL